MRWEIMTAAELVELRERCGGVAVITLGSLEKHSEHLPMGIDGLAVHAKAIAAAEIEPAAVLPPLYYTRVPAARHVPGAIGVRVPVLLDLLENVCDEVSRNGFHKICILNGHGGNNDFLRTFVRHMLDIEKPYTVYFLQPRKDAGQDPGWEHRLPDMHAGEGETSVAMHFLPEHVKADRIPQDPEYGASKRDFDVPAITSVDWTASFPDAYSGDAHSASAEKGRIAFDGQVKGIAEAIRAIREDDRVPGHLRDFHRKAGSL